MALLATSNAVPEPFAGGSRGQTGETVHGSVLVGTTGMFTDAHNLQIVNSNLTVAGRDVHNYYHSESKTDIWVILKLVTNFRDIYHAMLEKATPGTGMWLIKRKRFRVWLKPNGKIMIFWGSGIPGAGKTVLASIVIEHLESLRKESGGTVCICYVYFRYSDRVEMTVRDVLEILVKQTLERHPECQDLIESTYAQHLKEGSVPTEAQLLGLLRELVSRMSCTFYLLDALDEAPPKIQLAVVKRLVSLNVKLFITSRPLETVRAAFPQAHSFSITAQDTNLDLHIAKAISECADLQQLLRKEEPSLREEIVSTIKENCGGMFLHASLQLEALCDCISAREVRRTLKAFPSKIDDVYHYTWARILKQKAEHVLLAKYALVWVLNASRSMTVEELRRAVATSPDTHKFEADRAVPSATLISLCRGLVTVEEKGGLVRLIHYTAKETLKGLLCESFPHPQSLLATVCMTHLAECGFQNTTIRSDREFRRTMDGDPLLAYASQAWYLHACMSLEETKDKTTHFIKECSAFPAFTSDKCHSSFDILTPLHIMALYKVPMTLIEGVIMGDPNRVTTARRETPLMVAARSGYEGLVVYLLGLPEIQVNSVDNYRCSVLIRAAEAGHQGIFKLLLAHPGIQVNLVDNSGHSAIIWAAWGGHEGVLKLLLAHPGIQVNLVDNSSGRSALMMAASKGNEGIVKLLLAHPGTKVNLVDYYGCSALIRAAQAGHEGIAKLLLAHPGIQVNWVNGFKYSALILAAQTGHQGPGVVKLLLAHPEIQVNLVDYAGRSALTWAAKAGHGGIVKLLLTTNAFDINAFDINRDTAIKMAAEHGFENVVRLLLDIPNIDITIRSTRDEHTATSVAQANDHHVIAMLLQDFLSRNPAIAMSPHDINRLFLQESAEKNGSDISDKASPDSDSDKEDSDSGSGRDAFYDAEEGNEEDFDASYWNLGLF